MVQRADLGRFCCWGLGGWRFFGGDYNETADDYGDGAFDGKHSHIYDSTGIYCVTVRVTDSGEPPRTDTAWDYVRVYDVICVDKDATGSGQGYNWANAFTTIQAGIDASYSGNEIWVAEGTYVLTSQINVVYHALDLYGGFDGTETQLSERDWVNHVTAVDGDNSVRCFHVTKDAIIDGFTIKRGKVTSSTGSLSGGGLVTYGADVTITNCTFLDNVVQTSGNGDPAHTPMGGAICASQSGTKSYRYQLCLCRKPVSWYDWR